MVWCRFAAIRNIERVVKGMAKHDQQGNPLHPLISHLDTKSIVLVGMPGSGKSSVGRRLAQRLNLQFVDSDTKIEEAAGGMSVSDIFARHGEPEFRSLEARVITRLLENGPTVIATGGGAFVNVDTRSLIGRYGLSIWLKADIEILLRRVKRKNDRPLLSGNNPEDVLKRLLAERESAYEKADITVISREAPHESVVDAIIEELEKYFSGHPVEFKS
jgi:shikimate kinase